MGDIIKLDEHLPDPVDGSSEANERFLLDEGFELLAAYRGISDTEVRRSILALVHRLSALSRTTDDPPA